MNHDRLGLWENDREYCCNVHLESQLFCSISFHALWAIWCSFCSSILPCRAPWKRPFLIYVVRGREHPVLVYWTFLWIRFQPRTTFGIVSHNSNNSTLPNSRINAFELFLNGLQTLILLQVGLKCFSMRMTFDLLHELLNAEIFCFFHNGMWHSWYSEVNFYFLELGGLVHPRVSPFLFDLGLRFRLCLRVCLQDQQGTGTQLWMDFGSTTGLPFLVEFPVPSRPNKTSFSISSVKGCSPTGLLDIWVWLLLVGSLCCFQQLLNPILSSNYFWWKSLEEAEVTLYTFSFFFLISHIPSHQLSGYNKLGVCRKGWWRSVASDRTLILSFEQVWILTQYTVFWCFLHAVLHVLCKTAVLSGRLSQDLVLISGSTGRMSVLCSNSGFPVSILNWWWNVNLLHIRRDKCTRRSRPRIDTLSCGEGSLGLRLEWPWRARRLKISCLDESVQYWNIFFLPPPPAAKPMNEKQPMTNCFWWHSTRESNTQDCLRNRHWLQWYQSRASTDSLQQCAERQKEVMITQTCNNAHKGKKGSTDLSHFSMNRCLEDMAIEQGVKMVWCQVMVIVVVADIDVSSTSFHM